MNACKRKYTYYKSIYMALIKEVRLIFNLNATA